MILIVRVMKEYRMFSHLVPREVSFLRDIIRFMKQGDRDIPLNDQVKGICHRVPCHSIQHCMQPKLPNNVEEALESDQWTKAMEEEISALRKNGTWEKCILPKRKVVECK